MKMLDLARTEGLFDNFEVNGEPFWPKIVRLLGGSAILHVIVAASILLIPPVRDALSVAVMFRGASFVDRPYTRTEIENGDVVELTTEKFHYPEGYFAMDQQAMPTPEFPLPAAFKPRNIPPPLPSPPQPSPIASPSPVIPTNSPSQNANSKQLEDAKNSDDKARAQAQKDLEAASQKTGIELPKDGEENSKPFKDLAAYATELKNKGQLDFDKPFEVEIDTELDRAGKLVN